MGWEFYCKSELPIYMDLVREFYQNFRINENRVKSIVKGVDIDFDDEQLGTCLRLPCEGQLEDGVEDRKSRTEFVLGRNNVGQFEKIYARSLTIGLRLVHLVISWIICPRSGRFDLVTDRDMSIMYHIIRRIPFNLPKLMIKSMEEAVGRSQASLPYAMALTHVFRHFGINFRGEELCGLGRGGKINDGTLHRMHIFKVNGQWIKREGDVGGEDIHGGGGDQERRPASHDRADTTGPSTDRAGPSTDQPETSSLSRDFDDELRHTIFGIARDVTSIMQSFQTMGGSFARTQQPEPDTSIVPHISSVHLQLGEIMSGMRDMRHEIERLSRRVQELEHKVSAYDRAVSIIDTLPPQLSGVTHTLDVIRSSIQRGTDEMKCQSAILSTGLNSLIPSVNRIGQQMDTLVPTLFVPVPLVSQSSQSTHMETDPTRPTQSPPTQTDQPSRPSRPRQASTPRNRAPRHRPPDRHDLPHSVD